MPGEVPGVATGLGKPTMPAVVSAQGQQLGARSTDSPDDPSVVTIPVPPMGRQQAQAPSQIPGQAQPPEALPPGASGRNAFSGVASTPPGAVVVSGLVMLLQPNFAVRKINAISPPERGCSVNRSTSQEIGRDDAKTHQLPCRGNGS